MRLLPVELCYYQSAASEALSERKHAECAFNHPSAQEPLRSGITQRASLGTSYLSFKPLRPRVHAARGEEPCQCWTAAASCETRHDGEPCSRLDFRGNVLGA